MRPNQIHNANIDSNGGHKAVSMHSLLDDYTSGDHWKFDANYILIDPSWTSKGQNVGDVKLEANLKDLHCTVCIMLWSDQRLEARIAAGYRDEAWALAYFPIESTYFSPNRSI